MRRAASLAAVILVAARRRRRRAAPRPPAANAIALLVRVSVPGTAPITSGELVAPPPTDVSAPFLYPEDGSVVRVGSSTSSVAAQAGTSSSAQAVVGALAVSLLGGEVTAESVNVRATAAAGRRGRVGDRLGLDHRRPDRARSAGRPPRRATTVPLADWGTLEVLATTEKLEADPVRGAEAAVTGLRRHARHRPRRPAGRHGDLGRLRLGAAPTPATVAADAG